MSKRTLHVIKGCYDKFYFECNFKTKLSEFGRRVIHPITLVAEADVYIRYSIFKDLRYRSISKNSKPMRYSMPRIYNLSDFKFLRRYST